MLSAKIDRAAAKRFFRKALKATHNSSPLVINVDSSPLVINVDKNAVYPLSIEELKTETILAQACELRQNKNLVEQDHRFIKKLVNPGLGFKSFCIATFLSKSIEF